jgi:hypothetical protein
MRRPFAQLVQVLAVLGAIGCGAPASAVPTAFELQVDTVTVLAVDGVVPQEADVRAAIRDAARGLPSFADPTATPSPALETAVRLGEVEASDGGRVLRVELEAKVPAGQQAVLGAVVDATIELERRDGTLDADEDVPIALGRGVAVLDAKLRLVRGGEAEARTLLASTDPEIVVLALEQVMRQRWRGLADDVAALLGHDDERIVSAAVECLGIVGSPEHADALVKHVRLADADQARRLYDALASLGGSQARGFLEFAARNEDDPALADVAARALGRLRDEAAGGGSTGDDSTLLRGHRP